MRASALPGGDGALAGLGGYGLSACEAAVGEDLEE